MVSASGVSRRDSFCKSGGRFFAALGLRDGAGADKFEQTRLQTEVSFPKLAIIDIFDTFPNFAFGAAPIPSRA